MICTQVSIPKRCPRCRDTTNLADNLVLFLVLYGFRITEVLAKGSKQLRIIKIEIELVVVVLAFLAIFCDYSWLRSTRLGDDEGSSIKECLHQATDLVSRRQH